MPPVDLWLCLICGFTGCGASHGGHIQQHYEETLHTYAQNCDSRQVWDFAGDGYVHSLVLKDSSLLQLDADGAQESAAPQLTPFHIEQQTLMWGANQDRGRGSDQETSLVNAKLEAAARHYNQLLAWQMEQNRLLYETRLQRIRHSVPPADSNKTAKLSSSPAGTASTGPTGKAKHGGSSVSSRAEKSPRVSSSGGTSWRENMLCSLRSEKSKVLRQLEAAQERLARARQEADLLRDLHAGLSGNKDEWQRRVDSAASALREQEFAHKYVNCHSGAALHYFSSRIILIKYIFLQVRDVPSGGESGFADEQAGPNLEDRDRVQAIRHPRHWHQQRHRRRRRRTSLKCWKYKL